MSTHIVLSCAHVLQSTFTCPLLLLYAVDCAHTRHVVYVLLQASDWKQAAPYYGFMRWFLALKRVRYEPVFESASSSPGPSKRRSEAAAGVALSNKKQRPL